MQSLESVPTWLADNWNINLEAAQAILSIAVLLAVLLPVMMVAKGSRALAVEIIMLFLTECVLVGIGWMPFWVLIATVAVLALAVATIGTNAVIGG